MRLILLIPILALPGLALPQEETPEGRNYRVTALIDRLRDTDLEVRARAYAELRRMPPGIEFLLQEHAGDADAEVAGRCRDLLAELEQKKAAERRVQMGRIFHVDPKFNFILIDVGKEKGLQPGARFEIVRAGHEHGGRLRDAIRVAGAEFEKYIGEEQSTSKLRITEGAAADIRLDDVAAMVRGPAVARPIKGAERAKDPAPALAGKIALMDPKRGQVATDLRERDGVNAGEGLEVRREGKKVGTLIIKAVQAWEAGLRRTARQRLTISGRVTRSCARSKSRPHQKVIEPRETMTARPPTRTSFAVA